jgi:uncharacterized protein DUF1360
MSLWLRVILAVLAAWRVTHLLASEDGPGDLVYRLRARLGSSFAGKLMDCFYCLSLWVAVPFALLVTRQVPDWILTWLAISGAACLLERATQERAELRPPQIEGEEKHALLRSEERDPAKHVSGYQR